MIGNSFLKNPLFQYSIYPLFHYVASITYRDGRKGVIKTAIQVNPVEDIQ